MYRPLQFMPDPCLRRSYPAGERLRVGALLSWAANPENRRQIVLVNHRQPGGKHLNLFAVEDREGREFYEPGEQVSVVQYHGRMLAKVILRRGERVWAGTYKNGGTGGTDLASAGDGTGALVAASRFVSYWGSCGQATEDVDLTESDEDQLITVRTHIFSGDSIAEAG